MFTKIVGRILNDLHPQAGDDEEESGPHVSHVTGPKESAARPDMSLFPTHAQIRGNCYSHADAPHTKKLRRNSFESIGVAILRDATIELFNHRLPAQLRPQHVSKTNSYEQSCNVPGSHRLLNIDATALRVAL